jgi:biopolymer transport protein TolR
MGASLSTGSSKKQPEPEMNVTPLVDVVLVLLIIFMVIAPAVNDGEHIELPQIFKPDPKPKDLNPVDVVVALNGRVIVDKEPIARADLKTKLKQLHQQNLDRELVLKADTGMPYKDVRALLADIQTVGFKGLSLKVVEKKKAGAS